MMKIQNTMIHTLAKRSFKKNKGRNLVAVLAIFLTTMMFTSLFTLAQSMESNMTEMYLRQYGQLAHASTKQITDAQIEQIAAHPDIVNYGRSIVVGVAENADLAGRQLEIRYADEQYARSVFAYPVTGKMPEEKDEIALDTLTLERLGIPQESGQTVTLKWKEDINSSEITSHSFTLCGWWEGNLSSYASMAWVSEDFALEACGGAVAPAEGQVCGLRMMCIYFSDSREIDGKMASVLSDCGLAELAFRTNLAYSSETRQSILRESLPMYGGMVLVFLAGYLIIFNIFQISVASDIQFYGKLKTLGMEKKQIRKMISGEADRLSVIGIPAGLAAGYLLGMVLLPVLIVTDGAGSKVSVNPVIFIGSALFAWLTVRISCLLPARLAGKVSPMEALRYTDVDAGIRKKQKKTKNGAALSRMAWANLWRNRKRTVMVLCSLTLGLVLMSYFYAKNVSFDVEKYLQDMAVADYQIDDATNNNWVEGYDPASQTISAALLADIEALGTVEAEGRLYSRQIELTVSKETGQNIMNFYTTEILEDFASYDPSFPVWKEGYDRALAGQECLFTIYGADGLILEAAASDDYILDGTFDMRKFGTGDYCLAIGPSIEPGNGAPTYSVGEKVRMVDHEFEVMAVLRPLQPMVKGSQPAFDLPLVISADAFLDIWPDSNLRKYYFNIADGSMEDIYSLLAGYQQTSSPGMNIVSRQSMVEQYEAQVRSSAVMGYAISIIIALVGILNFINSMITAIISRKQEFAMIQSVGMTKRQLRGMLIFEGFYYAGMTLILAYVIGSVTVGGIVRAVVESGFSTFRFTLMPLMVCTPVLVAFAVFIPYLCFRNLEKQSVVERLRMAD